MQSIEKIAQKLGIRIKKDDPIICALETKLKLMDSCGYRITKVPASLELLVRDALGNKRTFFKISSYKVFDVTDFLSDSSVVEAVIKMNVTGKETHTASNGAGPIDALSNAFLKALIEFYPNLEKCVLEDFSVSVVRGDKGTASKVRVIVKYSDGHRRWKTVGVSENINRACWEAIVTSVIFKLNRDYDKKD